MASDSPERSDGQRWQKAYDWLHARAEKIANDSAKLKALLRQASEKIRSHQAAAGGILGEVTTLLRMLHARATGRYPDTPIKTIVAATVAVLYFVLPLDFIPDFIPVLGLTDDFAVIGFLLKMIADDLAKFRAWERDYGGSSSSDGLPLLE